MSEGQYGSHDARDAEIALGRGLDPGEQREGCRERHQRRRQQQRTADRRHRSRYPTQQSRQRVGAQARGALALGLLAQLPPPLQADQQADGERNSQAPKQVFLIHGLPINKSSAAREENMIPRDAWSSEFC